MYCAHHAVSKCVLLHTRRSPSPCTSCAQGKGRRKDVEAKFYTTPYQLRLFEVAFEPACESVDCGANLISLAFLWPKLHRHSFIARCPSDALRKFSLQCPLQREVIPGTNDLRYTTTLNSIRRSLDITKAPCPFNTGKTFESFRSHSCRHRFIDTARARSANDALRKFYLDRFAPCVVQRKER